MLDKYEVLQKIGEGGMATVYRGRHTTLGRDVAIKVLHPHLSASERNRQRFAREARAIEHLDHDNILKIFDYSGSGQDDCFIVTEYVDGVTIQELVNEHGRLPSEIVSLIGQELAQALSYAHDLGIIHRDLKLENVMIRRDGTVKLMDFGIARFLDEMNLTVTGALVGSPAYMSPEQAMERVLDLRSDLFSLGTLLFHMITGQLPFSGSNPSVILRNIIEGNRPEVMELTPDVSASLAANVEHLLEIDPDDRPMNAMAVHNSLRLSLTEVGIQPEDPTWSIHGWLTDPKGYHHRLQEHLARVLVEEGKNCLSAQNHLGALRLLNRMLSIDEQNEEVLHLVQQMHALGTPARRGTRWWAAALAIAVGASIITWTLWPSTPLPEPLSADIPPEGQNLSVVSGDAIAPNQPVSAAPVNTDGDDATGEDVGTPSAPTGSETALEAMEPETNSNAGGGTVGQPTTPDTIRTPPRPLPSPSTRTAVKAVPSDPPVNPGYVTVLVTDSWGEIYIDGEYKGRTGEISEIPVSPGTHTVRVENDLAIPVSRRIEVAPDEHVIKEFKTLQRRPATVIVAPTAAADCLLSLDGQPQGTLLSMNYRLELEKPDIPHTLLFMCPDKPEKLLPLPPSLPGATLSVTGP